MTRAVIYARFSTELQNEKSTEDQIALCRTYADRKIDVIATYATGTVVAVDGGFLAG
jgi:site-specific DNA recombinase